MGHLCARMWVEGKAVRPLCFFTLFLTSLLLSLPLCFFLHPLAALPTAWAAWRCHAPGPMVMAAPHLLRLFVISLLPYLANGISLCRSA